MSVHDFRPKADETKITINPGVVDLGQIDLLVQEGFYSNFIRTSIRNQLAPTPKWWSRQWLVKPWRSGCKATLEKTLRQCARLDKNFQIHVLGKRRR